MRGKRVLHLAVSGGFVLALALAIPIAGQQAAPGTSGTPSAGAATRTVTLGASTRVEGIIVSTEAGAFRLKESGGLEVNVVVNTQTRFKEKKSNPFREGEKYRGDELVRGLAVEVKGKGDAAGALLAEEVRFTQDDLRFANSLHTRVAPVEARLTDTEGRLTQSEAQAQHMAGQIDELSSISNAARGGAKAAQETADAAKEAAEAAQRSAGAANSGVRAANERISLLDDFDVRETSTLRFKAGSTALTPDAQSELERLANRTRKLSSYVVEVTGYASADGNESYNRQLSERRASAVVRYLVEQQDVPLRRIVTPFGFGSKHPVADNKTRDGRLQNRRVDIRILVSKGAEQKTESTAAVQAHSN